MTEAIDFPQNKEKCGLLLQARPHLVGGRVKEVTLLISYQKFSEFQGINKLGMHAITHWVIISNFMESFLIPTIWVYLGASVFRA